MVIVSLTMTQEKGFDCDYSVHQRWELINHYLFSYQLLVQSSNRNTRKRCEVCSKLTIKTLDGQH